MTGCGPFCRVALRLPGLQLPQAW